MNYFHKPQTKKEAERRADELVAYLNKAFNTDKWKPRVHENLGWHYNAQCGSISVSASELGRGHEDKGGKSNYFTLISDMKGKPYYGAGVWSSNGDSNHEKPDESVKIAMKIAIEVTRNLKSVLEENVSFLNLNEKI